MKEMIRSLKSKLGWKPLQSTAIGGEVCLFTKRPILHLNSTPKSLEDALDELQTVLQAKGLLSNFSGKFDNETESAVKKFQKRNNLHEDGIVGPLTWACLYHPELSHQQENTFPEKKEAIRKLHTILRQENFSIRDLDGHFGRDTERAVRSFQRTYGLKADGIVGAWTWTILLGVRQKTRQDFPGSIYFWLRQNLFLWEQSLTVTCVLLGIYYSPIPSPLLGKTPSISEALVTAYGLTCVTPFVLNLLKLKHPDRSSSLLLQYAPYVLTGIFWKPVLDMIVRLMSK